MIIMKFYGSIVNRLEENKIYGGTEIYVGMGVTEYLWSDREPYEVVAVHSQKDVEIRRMDWKLISGSCQSEDQEYKFISNPRYQPLRVKKYKRGWYEVHPNENGRLVQGAQIKLSFGVMDKYYDPCF